MVFRMACGIYGMAFGKCCHHYRNLDMDGILKDHVRSSVATLKCYSTYKQRSNLCCSEKMEVIPFAPISRLHSVSERHERRHDDTTAWS